VQKRDVKVRLACVVSVYEIVSARAALDREALPGEVYEDHLIMIHTLLTEGTKSQMRKLAAELDFLSSIDLAADTTAIMKCISFKREFSNPFSKFIFGLPDLNIIREKVGKLRSTLYSKFGPDVSAICVRWGTTTLDRVIPNIIYPNAVVYAVPETPVAEHIKLGVYPFRKMMSHGWLMKKMAVKNRI